MLTYRRKPLEVLPTDTVRLAAESVSEPARRRAGPAVTDSQAVGELASMLPPQTRHEPAAPQPDPGGADLVARAVEILHKELAAGALAASGAPHSTPVLPLFTGSPLSPTDGLLGKDNGLHGMANLLPCTPSGLPVNVGELMSAFTRLAAQARHPVGTGQSPVAGLFGAPSHVAMIPAEEEAVLLRPSKTVRAGEQTTIPFKLHNDSFQPVHISLQATDLSSPTGQRIPLSEISFDPQDLSLTPDGVTEVVITIRIPASTPVGVYSGQLTASALPYLRGVMEVTIA